MLQLLREQPRLRFSHGAAEQDFLKCAPPCFCSLLYFSSSSSGEVAGVCAWSGAAQRQRRPAVRALHAAGRQAPLARALARRLTRRRCLPPLCESVNHSHSWYFRYTMMMLPMEYNTMASDSLLPDGRNLTVGGVPPALVHFTRNKPFGGPEPGKPGHQLLCSAEELAASAS